jgi:ketosteroid isomerase-like protein
MAALAVTLAATTTSAISAQADDVAAVEQAGETLRKLMINPDRAALERTFADQLSYGHSDGRVQTKAEFTDALLHGKSVFTSISLSGQTISLVGDIAIVRHRFEADAISNGVPAQPRIRILQVWQKQGDAWRLLVRQAH